MIIFEMGFLMIVIVAIGGPLVYFGMRRYLRWMSTLSANEEARDKTLYGDPHN